MSKNDYLMGVILEGWLGSDRDNLISYDIKKIIKRRLSTVYVCNFNYPLETKKILIKKYNSISEHKICREYENGKFIYDAFRNTENIRIPETLYFNSKELLLITEYLDDIKSYESLINPFSLKFNNNYHKIICKGIGRNLSAFHSNKGLRKNEKVYDDYYSYHSYLNKRFRLIAEYLHDYVNIDHSAYFEKKISEMFDRYLNNFFDDSECSVFAHYDLTPSNILIDHSGKSTSFIDFSESRYASRHMDIACFCNYLSMLKLNYPVYDERSIKSVIDSFKCGYRESMSIDDGLFNVYSLRFLVTNTLTGIYEMKKSPLRRYLLKNRLKRYVECIVNAINS